MREVDIMPAWVWKSLPLSFHSSVLLANGVFAGQECNWFLQKKVKVQSSIARGWLLNLHVAPKQRASYVPVTVLLLSKRARITTLGNRSKYGTRLEASEGHFLYQMLIDAISLLGGLHWVISLKKGKNQVSRWYRIVDQLAPPANFSRKSNHLVRY
jgi:hypothetical protein